MIAVALAAMVYGRRRPKAGWRRKSKTWPGLKWHGPFRTFIRGAYQPRTGAIATVLGLATLIFGASSIFVELHEALNTIWHVSPPPGRTNAATVIHLIRDRFYSFATVVGIGFLLLVSLVLNAWMAAMKIAVPRAAAFLILYLIIAVLFAALYKIVPDVRLKWSDVALGAMIAALLFVIGKQSMALYFAHATFGTYSAAGSPIVVLLWVYCSAQLFFWGAEFSKVYKKTVGSQTGRRH